MEKPKRRRWLWWTLGVATVLAAMLMTAYNAHPHFRLSQTFALLKGKTPRVADIIYVDLGTITHTPTMKPMVEESETFDIPQTFEQANDEMLKELNDRGGNLAFANSARGRMSYAMYNLLLPAGRSSILVSRTTDGVVSVTITQVRDAGWLDKGKAWVAGLFHKQDPTHPFIGQKISSFP